MIPAAAARLRRRPVVLMYHGFSAGPRENDPYDLFVADAALRAQLSMLQSHGWCPLDLDGYLAALDGGTGGRAFLVTIDDGFDSVLSVGAPVLAEAGVPSVLFIPPAVLNGASRWLDAMPAEPMLTDDELRTLVASGVEVGGHGWDHSSMVAMTDEELLRNTRETRERLADLTGTAPRAFAYPFGYYDERALRAVERAGYSVAFSVYEDSGRFAVSRSDVKPNDSLAALRVKLVPGYRVVWRAAGAIKPLRRGLRRLAQRA